MLFTRLDECNEMDYNSTIYYYKNLVFKMNSFDSLIYCDRIDFNNNEEVSNTKFSATNLQLPAGENYREMGFITK